MAKVPVIGLPAVYTKYYENLMEKLGKDEPAWFIARDIYYQAIEKAGGAVVLINFTENKDIIDKLYEICDGILFPGGLDINPAFYNEEAIAGLVDKLDEARDILEPYLFKKAIKDKKPCLGICRGAQLFNVCEGGSLHQCIEQQLNIFGHATNPRKYPSYPDSPKTEVKVEKNSKLYHIVGSKFICNCAHHQAVKNLAPGYKIAGKAKDGIIEAIEKDSDGHWVLGMQGHPEVTFNEREQCFAIFKEFVSQCFLWNP